MKFFHTLTRVQLAVFIFAIVLSFGVVYALTSSKNSTIRANQASCSGTCVALTATGATPNTIAIAEGTYVQFNSADGKSHNLSIGGGGDEHEHTGKFYSGEFKADEAWRVQFNDEGTFKFHDHFNPKINVVVVVYTPDKEYRVE